MKTVRPLLTVALCVVLLFSTLPVHADEGHADRSLREGELEVAPGERQLRLDASPPDRVAELLCDVDHQLRGLVVVGLLLVSVIGTPWAIRQLIRYQFIAQVTHLRILSVLQSQRRKRIRASI